MVSLLHKEFVEKKSFNKMELLAMSHGSLVEDPPSDGFARLPAPPFLMFDRITQIERNGRKGSIVAEQDLSPDDWFFQCHFRGDPVQPGCLGVDAIWQLIGFYGAARGAIGYGRALGSKEIDFFGQIRPHDKKVRYEVNIRRYTHISNSAIAIGDGKVFVDDQHIYTVTGAKVGIYKNIAYKDYPDPNAPNAKGGILESN